MRRGGSRSVSHLHDRTGRHSHAIVFRQREAGRGLGPGVLLAGITGTIKLEGTAPHQRPIDMSKEPACAAVHKANPVTTENVVAGSGGGLKNVVVYISEGLSGSAENEVASSKPIWDQKGCQYIPHVMGLNPNQHFEVTNSDPTSHNIHPMPKPGGPNHEWNKSQ